MTQQKTINIFINYRWVYSYMHAMDLEQRIKSAFENVHVFRDEGSIQKGDLLTPAIQAALKQTDLVLALIHKDWHLEPKMAGKSRGKIWAEDCFIRQELEQAHQQSSTRILPVLVNGAQLLAADDADIFLPSCLQFLNSDINHCIIHQEEYQASILELLRNIKTLFPELKEKAEAPKTKNCLESHKLFLPPTLQALPDKKAVPAPYLGLPYFKREHARLFFGRSQDICTLWEKIAFEPEQVVLLYGYSGVGKSSLLNAGLLPRLTQQNWETRIERRDKDQSLSTVLLPELLKDLATDQEALVCIDQLEEAMITPSGETPNELPQFMEALAAEIRKRPHTRFLLGFRKEYLGEVQEALAKKDLKAQEHFLKPLDEQGLLEAIQLDQEILFHYGFSIERDVKNPNQDLPQRIVGKMHERDAEIHASEISNKAPWLQLLLSRLWEEGVKEKAVRRKENPAMNDPIKLTNSLLDKVWKGHFPQLIEEQLNTLNLPTPNKSHHREHFQSGLSLSLLYFLTTERNTSAFRFDADLEKHFAPGDKERGKSILQHLREIEKLQLVIRGKDFTRLAHDSLAPVIRQLFRQSPLPGPRAWQIVEPKLQDLENGRQPTLLSFEDWKIVDAGRPGLRDIGALEGLLSQSLEVHKQALTREAHLKRDLSESANEKICEQILALDYESAFGTLKNAIGLDHNQPVFIRHLQELAFWWSETNKTQNAITAIEKLHQLQLPAYDWLKTEYSRLKDGAGNLEEVISRIDTDQYTILRRRYFPHMIEVPGGRFEMGKVKGQLEERVGATPLIQLDTFQIAQTPTTLWQYGLYCEGGNTGSWRKTLQGGWAPKGNTPVIKIDWYEAIEYVNWLSEQMPGGIPFYQIEKLTKDLDIQSSYDSKKWLVLPGEGQQANGFKLPTEAEWEFAARGGEVGINGPDFTFAGSDNIEEVAWYDQNAQRTMPVGTELPLSERKKANGLGLFDMSGNIWEWCWDWYAESYDGQPKSNPNGPESGDTRVVRGGSWVNYSIVCRSAFRVWFNPFNQNYDLGFRVARRL